MMRNARIMLSALLVMTIWACDGGSSNDGSDTGSGGTGGQGGMRVDDVGAGGQADMGDLADMAETDAAVDMGPPPGPCAMPIECPPVPEDPSAIQPPPLNEHAAVYDPDRRMMIIFGGNTAVPEMCGFPDYAFLDRTWLYLDHTSADCGHWIEVEGDSPPGRTRHAATFGNGAMWVFGGRYRSPRSRMYQVHSDLWRFDTEARTWREIEIDGPAPDGRYNTSLVYDPQRNQLLLFGGNTAASPVAPVTQNDVWRFDIAAETWEEVETGGVSPSKRMWHTAFFDATRDQMLIYSGGDETAFNNDARYMRDIHAFYPSSNRWELLNSGAQDAPQGRFWAAMTHDTAQDKYLLFAGHDDAQLGNRNDTWFFDPEARTWESAAVDDTFNAPANGFCDFPPDFTNVERGIPERRNAHSLVYSPVCEHALVFGGKSDCGAVNDVWTHGIDGWANPVEATAGEACIRWRNNPDNCANMCF